MTVDLSAVDAANTALQADPKAAKTTKAYAAAVTKALHAMSPSPPPTSLLLGVQDNVSGGGSFDLVAKLGAKITREDGASAIGQFVSAGIKVVQIIPQGNPGAADSRAYCFEAGGNEPNRAGVDAAAWAVQTRADARAIRNAHPGVPIIATLSTIYGSPEDDGRSNYVYGQYTHNGVTKMWTDWISGATVGDPLGNHVDGWSVHPYWDAGYVGLDTIRAQLKQLGPAWDKPFWITEDGYTTYQHSEQQQADYLATRIADARKRSDLACWILFRAKDIINQQPPSENNFGVERTNPDWSDGGPKAAFAVVKAAFAQ